jgi:hypothetical protein
MPTLVPLQDDTTSVIVARRYPKQSNQSPFLTPPKKFNATSLLGGYDMTSLDHLSPAGATLDQIHYAQEHIELKAMRTNTAKTMTTIQKIGIVNFAVTTMMMIASPPPFGGGNFLKEETAEEAARLFKYSDDDYNHLDDDYLNEDER